MSNEEAKLMSDEVCHYISERRDKKELSLLKDKPNKKGKGGINNRLLSLAKKLFSTDPKLKEFEKDDKAALELKYQQARYESLLSLLDDTKNGISSIQKEYAEAEDKKKLTLLKNKPRKSKTGIKGGLNIRLMEIADKSEVNPHQIKLSMRDYKDQLDLEFQKAKYSKLTSILDDYQSNNDYLDIVSEYRETLQKINSDHVPVNWLNEWAPKAKDISFATHVAKLTHSSSKSSSINDKTNSKDSSYLTTNSLKNLVIDTATDNAASAPSGEILTLEANGKSLLDYIKDRDSTIFKQFTESHTELNNWMSSFKQTYDSDSKNSHYLSKQIYFPVGDDSYHLLLPLASSSLAQALHVRFKAFFDEENAQIIEQKKNSKYHKQPSVYYPNRASLSVTGSNHSNASSLNGKRGGKMTLLSCVPPQWKVSQQFSLKQNNLFNRQLGFKLSEEVKLLQRLLIIIKTKKVGMKKPEMHQAIVNDVNNIAQSLFVEILRINLSAALKGWTCGCSLPLHQQLLIEPYRDDDKAVQEKQEKQWIDRVADDFSYWLNKQLKHKQLNLTPIQQRLWRDMFFPHLLEFIASQEVTP